jgi:hypothetical protein
MLKTLELRTVFLSVTGGLTTNVSARPLSVPQDLGFHIDDYNEVIYSVGVHAMFLHAKLCGGC